LFEVFCASVEALHVYELQQFSTCPLREIRARESHKLLGVSASLKEVECGDREITVIPGDHFSIMAESNAPRLAAAVDKILETSRSLRMSIN
jgi:thioesterase domain-containing protein